MKYLIIFSAIATLSGCDILSPTTVEEYKARISYCEENGFGYTTSQNGPGHTFVKCTKDGKEFQSKWENK